GHGPKRAGLSCAPLSPRPQAPPPFPTPPPLWPQAHPPLPTPPAPPAHNLPRCPKAPSSLLRDPNRVLAPLAPPTHSSPPPRAAPLPNPSSPVAKGTGRVPNPHRASSQRRSGVSESPFFCGQRPERVSRTPVRL